MKIIKQGSMVETMLKTVTFECDNCGCIFEANKQEYTVKPYRWWDFFGGDTYTCKCPYCNENVRVEIGGLRL